ncbi:hypothetical protein HPG69_001352 [Diceros bicornis minor]|uniref:Bone morphogenetic protein 3 n=1 Tax=Diceros bicornis minor TaxID=77932 RepID=A0A7J7FF81_DICBM|nr:hypothetical protein HPG69_001352 [Diceros bicornis minor]
MAGAHRLLYLWLGCFCVSLARGERLKQYFPELRKAVPGDHTAGGGSGPVLRPHDKVSEHMLRLYDRYSGGGRAEAARTPGISEPGSQSLSPQPLREGNTVRSFRAGTAELPRDLPSPSEAALGRLGPVTPRISPGSKPSFRVRIERQKWREGRRAVEGGQLKELRGKREGVTPIPSGALLRWVSGAPLGTLC